VVIATVCVPDPVASCSYLWSNRSPTCSLGPCHCGTERVGRCCPHGPDALLHL